jgi:hypothetical protein
VRSETDLPCGRPAAVTILGVRLCERCAREQETYFAVGELTEVPRGGGAGRTNARDAKMTRRSVVPAGLWRRLRQTVFTSGKVSFMVAASVSVFAATACGETERARGGSAAADPKVEQKASAQERARAAEATAEGNGDDGAVARPGDAEARTAGGALARAGDVQARSRDGAAVSRGYARAQSGSTVIVGNGREDVEGNGEGEAGPRKVTLQIKGDPGTGFSGACSVGGEAKALDGRAPESYAFKLRGKKLECEIRKEGEGVLEVVIAAGESIRSVQRTHAREGTLRFAFSGGSIFSSTSSVSVDQTVTASVRSSSRDSR